MMPTTIYIPNFRAVFFRLRSYLPGNTASRPISAVKQGWAFSSTVVREHTETKRVVIFLLLFAPGAAPASNRRSAVSPPRYIPPCPFISSLLS